MQLRSLNPFSDPLNPGLIRAGNSWDGPRFFFNASVEGLGNLEEELRQFEVTETEIRWKKNVSYFSISDFLLHPASSILRLKL